MVTTPSAQVASLYVTRSSRVAAFSDTSARALPTEAVSVFSPSVVTYSWICMVLVAVSTHSFDLEPMSALK